MAWLRELARRLSWREGHETLPALLVLTTLVVGLLPQFVLGGGVFFERDIHLAWQPQVESFVRSIALGAWPLWDRSMGFGQPLLADPSAQLLYPPSWLNLLMPPWVTTRCSWSDT
jgi:hypothetical protein